MGGPLASGRRGPQTRRHSTADPTHPHAPFRTGASHRFRPATRGAALSWTRRTAFVVVVPSGRGRRAQPRAAHRHRPGLAASRGTEGPITAAAAEGRRSPSADTSGRVDADPYRPPHPRRLGTRAGKAPDAPSRTNADRRARTIRGALDPQHPGAPGTDDSDRVRRPGDSTPSVRHVRIPTLRQTEKAHRRTSGRGAPNRNRRRTHRAHSRVSNRLVPSGGLARFGRWAPAR